MMIILKERGIEYHFLIVKYQVIQFSVNDGIEYIYKKVIVLVQNVFKADIPYFNCLPSQCMWYCNTVTLWM